MKYILYARKSSEDKDRQAMSIPAQIRELTQLGEKLGFKFDETYTEEKSAKKRGRPEFGKMLKYLAKQEGCCLVTWKCDRLARNNFDGAEIVDLLQEGNIKEIKTIDRTYTNTASELFNLMQEFGMGKKFSDDLSVNVKRGNQEKLLNNGWPHKAPFGYLNDKAEKTILVDKPNAKYIVRLFELYSMGNKSFKEVANILFEEGLRTKGGNKVSPGTLHHQINNPFYYGVMLDKGTYYPGKHKPIISKKVFDRAQEVLHGKNDSRKTERFYPYRGFMTCADCGCVLTPDIKKEKYVYYFCTDGKGICKQHEKYMPSKKADELMANCLDMIHFNEEMIEMAYQSAKLMSASSKDSQQELAKSIESRLKSIQEKRSKLIDTYLDNGLPKVDYDAKSNELQAELIDLENQKENISKIIKNEDSTFELTKEVFLTANKAKNDFVNAKDGKRVIVLENLLSNLVVKDKEMASVSFKMPYEILKNHPKTSDFSQMWAYQDSNLRPRHYQ